MVPERPSLAHQREWETLYGGRGGKGFVLYKKSEWCQRCYWLHFSLLLKEKKHCFNTHRGGTEPMTFSKIPPCDLELQGWMSRPRLSSLRSSHSALCGWAERTSRVISQYLQKPKEWGLLLPKQDTQLPVQREGQDSTMCREPSHPSDQKLPRNVPARETSPLGPWVNQRYY